eukprot:1735139-Pyramimonas_sp.AAC.1
MATHISSAHDTVVGTFLASSSIEELGASATERFSNICCRFKAAAYEKLNAILGTSIAQAKDWKDATSNGQAKPIWDSLDKNELLPEDVAALKVAANSQDAAKAYTDWKKLNSSCLTSFACVEPFVASLKSIDEEADDALADVRGTVGAQIADLKKLQG